MLMNNITLWVRRYVTVYGIIMLCTFFMCLLFNPTSELPVVTFFGRIMVFTLIALLSLAVYYSKDELTVKAWWVRTALHLLLLLAKALWHLVDYGLNAKTAAQINERIRKNRLEKRT